MNKPITKNGFLNFNHLFDFIKRNSFSCLKYSIFMLLLFIAYFFLKTPSYTSKLTFYTNYSELNNTSFLSPFLGDIAGTDESGLNFLVSEYLLSDRFLDQIVSKDYIINEDAVSLIEHWGVHYNKYFTFNPISFLKAINRNIMFSKNLSNEEKQLSFAKEVLSGKIRHSEDRRSGLNVITIQVKKYPTLANQINNEIYLSVLDYSNKVNNLKANEKIAFIQDRLDDVQSYLFESEEKMLLFLEENKNFQSSPSLTLEKNRLQREINAYNQIYLSLLDQYELTKIDSKDNTNSVFRLDNAFLNSEVAGINFLQGILGVFSLAYILSLSLKMLSKRDELFL